MVRYNSPSLADTKAVDSVTVRSLGFFWGLVPPKSISLDQCGRGGIKKMKVGQGALDSLITYCTAGFVVSYKVKITCAK